MPTANTSPTTVVTSSNTTKPHNLSDAIASVITGLNYRPKNLEEARLTQQAAQKSLADLVANTHATAPTVTVPRGNPQKPISISDALASVLAGINYCPNTLTAAKVELASVKDSLSALAKTAAQPPPAQPAPPATPPVAKNAFEVYKSLSGQQRTDFFNLHSRAIWSAYSKRDAK